jgi:RNA polymerase sigma-70 factor, ECF subfamily
MSTDERTNRAAAPAASDSTSEPPQTLPVSSAKRLERMASPDGMLAHRLRSGDAEAGYRFVRDYYPRIFHYLLYLTGRREVAEDLTQETFLQAWRRLDTFDDRLALGPWLCQIARREFLQALRRRRSEASLEEVAEVAALRTGPETDGVELGAMLAKLPRQEREVVVLHDLEGYTSEEIARILDMPAGTVRYRLSEARERLRAELGEGDLLYLNEPSVPMRQWRWLPMDQMHALATRLTRTRAASQQAPGSGATTEDEMERREFLRQAAVGAAGLMLSETEKEIVDSRLTQKVTCAFKGTALSDLCEKLKADTGVHMVAGPSVADEKVTLFCEKLPLRDVMRQLSRPFGYTWLRSGRQGEYKYELVQDLRSQLLEEELRNRDRNQALLALEQEMERYRPYLGLSPDEALAKAKTAPAAEKPLLEKFAGYGWGPIQLYFRLSPHDQAALRAGQQLTFSASPLPGQQTLPADLAGGVLQSFRQHRLVRHTDRVALLPVDVAGPGGVPLTAAPEVRPLATLSMQQSELGQFTIDGHSGVSSLSSRPDGFYMTFRGGPYGVGQNRAASAPDNSRLNARLALDPAFRPRVTIAPAKGKSAPLPMGDAGLSHGAASHGGGAAAEKVTTADVLEALHRATGMQLVADYYTRLYDPATVSARDLPLFDVVCQLSDTMRLRWQKEERWLQFRSATFYDDRTKEVPNRLLVRWIASRRQNGALTLNDLIEIAQLPDAPLDGEEMAEGARDYLGLVEWDLARHRLMRPHLRFLAMFTPEQRQEAAGTTGLPFTKMTLAQQQQFIALALPPDDPVIQSMTSPRFGSTRLLEELRQAVLRVEYTQPGWFQWGDPASAGQWYHWVVPVKPGPDGWRVPRPAVRERTREAALQALRRLDPQLREAAVHSRPLPGAAADSERPIPLEAQIFPTELSLTVVYVPGAANALPIRTQYNGSPSWQLSQ